MSPAVALVPTTACEAIDSAPSLIAIQPAPRPTVRAVEVIDPTRAGVVQVTATLVTLAEPIVPLPLATLQVWPLGFVLTVTL